MPDTYSQIYIQVVFTVKGRQNLIAKKHREELHKYITGIVTNRKQKLLCIFAMPDHIHILIGLSPTIAISDLVRDIKSNSSKFISNNKWNTGKFQWQKGFGAFSYSKNHVDKVVKYILNQEKHHKKETFKEEYLELLQEHEIKHKDDYLFEWIET